MKALVDLIDRRSSNAHLLTHEPIEAAIDGEVLQDAVHMEAMKIKSYLIFSNITSSSKLKWVAVDPLQA